MKKRLLIFSTIAVLILLMLLFIMRPVSPEQNEDIQRPLISNNDIQSSIATGLKKYDIVVTNDTVQISNSEFINNSWLHVDASLLSEPPDSEARNMAYILHYEGPGKLSLVAFSGDGFTEDSFPSTTPKDIIQKAIERW